jgi:hypothetical protein
MPAEKLAWQLLRNRQLLHYKFRRQVLLGNAIVDFCCLSMKLVIELDGAGHAYQSQERSATGSGIREATGAPFPEWYCVERASGVCEENSRVHRPVGAGSLEGASSLSSSNVL